MNSLKSEAIIELSGSGHFKRYTAGEVIRAEFDGDPLISSFCEKDQNGSFVRLSRARVEKDFETWASAAAKEFGSLARHDLQTKFVCAPEQEDVLVQLAKKHGFKPSKVAKVAISERLECFFYCASGRLRAAPIETKQKRTGSVDSTAGLSQKSEKVPGLGRKSRVLVVDDSKTMRQLLKRIINESPDLEVVGEAERPSQVEALITELKPDVLTLDIQMPEMTGVELLKRLLKHRFIPAVMISSLGKDEGNEVLDALEIGAVDYIQKPSANELGIVAPVIQEKIFAASLVIPAAKKSVRRVASPMQVSKSGAATFSKGGSFSSLPLLAIGASTGGTEAIKALLMGLPADIPPTMIVQHIPPYFSTAFAKRLNDICPFEVLEAKDGDEVRPGRVLIAPGGLHMEVYRDGKKLVARVFNGDPVNRFRPSVDVLFNSVCKVIGAKATGVLLTGMGSDGAQGLLAMKKTGSVTIAQDEASCVVFGMPRAAIEIGGATLVKSLDEIPEALVFSKTA